ncbi:MAG: energy transducer TonB, partial [Phycisphaerae bacterium]
MASPQPAPHAPPASPAPTEQRFRPFADGKPQVVRLPAVTIATGRREASLPNSAARAIPARPARPPGRPVGPPAAYALAKLESLPGTQVNDTPVTTTVSPSSEPGAAQRAAAPAVPVAGENRPPAYPMRARRNGWEGAVLLSVQLTPTGKVASVTVAESSGHPVLDDAAVAAVRDWRFIPARVGGIALGGAVRVPIIFRLDDDAS